MAKSEKESPKEVKLRAISYAVYVPEAAEQLKKAGGNVLGMDRAATLAVCLLYQSNVVVDKFVLGGETFFICEV